MALTSVDVASATQIPAVLSAAIAISTAAALGLAFANTSAKARFVEVVGDNDWYWHQSDSQVIANMRKVPAGVAYRLQLPPGQTINLYALTATTANLVATVEL